MALRSCIVFAFLCCTLGSLAQPLNGSFMQQDQTAGTEEGYHFSPQGEFSWFKRTTRGKELGTGIYNVATDSLQLNFKITPRLLDIQAQSAVRNNTSKATVRVNVIRASGKTFAGLKFTLPKSNITGETDRSGTAFVQIEDPRDRDEIYFEIDGYRTMGLPINLKNNDNFFAIVVDDVTRYRENVRAKFKIDRARRFLKLANRKETVVLKKASSKKYMSSYRGN